MTSDGREERPTSRRYVHMGDGSSYSEGVKASGDINIDGDLDLSVTASTVNRSPEPPIVVDELLREQVDHLCWTLAAQGFTGDQTLEEAVELRDEVAGPTAVRRRVDELLAAIARRAGQVTVVATAIEATRQVLGH